MTLYIESADDDGPELFYNSESDELLCNKHDCKDLTEVKEVLKAILMEPRTPATTWSAADANHTQS